MYTPPLIVSAVALYLMYRATEVSAPSSQRAYACGVVLMLTAALLLLRCCRQRRTWDTQQLESELQHVNQRLRDLDHRQAVTEEDVRSRIALEEWLKATHRADAHRAGGWVHLNKRS